MRPQLPLKTISPTATVAMILGHANTFPPAMLPQAGESPKAVHAAVEAGPGYSAPFFEDTPRSFQAPYPFPWRHGGLND